MKLDSIYEEKVYAGVLGKIIGVSLSNMDVIQKEIGYNEDQIWKLPIGGTKSLL